MKRRKLKKKVKKIVKIKKTPAPKPAKKVKKIPLKPIETVARSIGIKKKFLENHGPYAAKINLDILMSKRKKKDSRYILVTSITPTPFGEGKTVTTIGLSMALNKLKKKAVACISQPSVALLMGAKGPGTGFGFSQVLPFEDISMYLTYDTNAVETAHNFCASVLDDSIFRGNPLGFDLDNIVWKRVSGIEDRALRNVNIGLGGKSEGVARKTGFEITAASELMALLEIAESLTDLKNRVDRITVGFTKTGKPITCEDLKISGAIAVMLKNAMSPTIIETQEGTPCFMHAGSFGNISYGQTSLVADRIGLKHCEYVITESGASAELGAEKFFDLKCRASGLTPDAVVLVCTVRGLKMHSGDYEISKTKKIPRDIARENISSVERGLSNLEKQVENLEVFGIPIVLCVNRFPDDTEKEIAAIRRRAESLNIRHVAVSEACSRGSEGAEALAREVIAASKTRSKPRYLYPLDLPTKDKVKRIAKSLYGAKEIAYSDEVNKKLLFYKKLKLDNLPVCMAKTGLSLSHNPKKKGRPHGFKLPVTDVTPFTGAGFINVFCDDITTMPSLPSVIRATRIEMDQEGKVKGLKDGRNHKNNTA